LFFVGGASNLMNRLSLNDGIIIDSDLESVESDSNDYETSDSERDQVGVSLVKRKTKENNKRQRIEDSIISEQATIIAIKRNKICNGFSTEFEETIFTYFPFQLFQYHDFNFTFEHGKFHSKICYESGYFCENDKTVNEECLNLKYDVKFQKILDRMETISKFTNHQYMNYNQLIDKISHYVMKNDEMRLNCLNKDFMLISYRNKIGLYQRFNNLLANSDVERLKQLMTVCLKKKMGIRSIINKFISAANDLYRPKQWNQNDVDLGIIFLAV
jgi:hypothetical protein